MRLPLSLSQLSAVALGQAQMDDLQELRRQRKEGADQRDIGDQWKDCSWLIDPRAKSGRGKSKSEVCLFCVAVIKNSFLRFPSTADMLRRSDMTCAGAVPSGPEIRRSCQVKLKRNGDSFAVVKS